MKKMNQKKNHTHNRKPLVLNSLNFMYLKKKNTDQFEKNKDFFFMLNKNRNDLKINLPEKNLATINRNLEKKKKNSINCLKTNNLKPMSFECNISYLHNKTKNILNFKKVNVFIIKLEKTFSLDLLKIVNSQNINNKFTCFLQKGSILEANASSLGLITRSGILITKIFAKVTNSPYRDGCVNCIAINNFDFK
nr:hypothetical protein CcurKRNrm2_p091 [Cryptomonas curvata]